MYPFLCRLGADIYSSRLAVKSTCTSGGWRRRDRLMDRSEGRADGHIHHPGDRRRGAPDIAPRLAHLGLLGNDEVVRPVAVTCIREGGGTGAPETLVNCVAPGWGEATRATTNLRSEQIEHFGRYLVLGLKLVIATGRFDRSANIVCLDAPRHVYKSLSQAGGGFENPVLTDLPPQCGIESRPIYKPNFSPGYCQR